MSEPTDLPLERLRRICGHVPTDRVVALVRRIDRGDPDAGSPADFKSLSAAEQDDLVAVINNRCGPPFFHVV